MSSSDGVRVIITEAVVQRDPFHLRVRVQLQAEVTGMEDMETLRQLLNDHHWQTDLWLCRAPKGAPPAARPSSYLEVTPRRRVVLEDDAL